MTEVNSPLFKKAKSQSNFTTPILVCYANPQTNWGYKAVEESNTFKGTFSPEFDSR